MSNSRSLEEVCVAFLARSFASISFGVLWLYSVFRVECVLSMPPYYSLPG